MSYNKKKNKKVVFADLDKKLPPLPPWHLVQLGKLYEDFEKYAAQFTHIMKIGGGIKNLHMGDTIRNLQFVYLQIAAHIDAARDIKKDASLENGIQALNDLREIEKGTVDVK